MAKAVPIRPDVTFSCDLEREMIDYMIGRVRIHAERWGEAPHTAAIVLTSDGGRSVHSLTTNADKGDRLATCSAAAAMLLQRAADDD